jgi:hypothetical protein
VMGALDALGSAAAAAGRTRWMYEIAAERLGLLDALPWHQPYAAAEIVDVFHAASTAAIAAGELRAALELAHRAGTEDPSGDHPYLATPRMVRVLALTGQFDEALRYADTMWRRWQEAGAPAQEWMSTAVVIVALVHGLRDDGEYGRWRDRAREVAGGVADPADSLDLAACAAFVDARVAAHLGRYGDAAALVERAAAPFVERWYEHYARAAGAELAVMAGLPDAADRLAAARPSATQNAWAAACLARARGRLEGDPAALAEAVAGWERIGARFERACTLLLIPERAEEGRAELDLLGATLPLR